MVDYSGQAVNTYEMTRGLFDALDRSMTNRQSREAQAAKMRQDAYVADQNRQIGDGIADGSMSPNSMLANMARAGALPQAVEMMKLSPQNFRNFGIGQQGAGNQGPAGQPLAPGAYGRRY